MNIIIQITPSGYFQVTPHSVGLTNDEAIAIERGELAMDKFEAMLANVRFAMATLAETPTCGSC